MKKSKVILITIIVIIAVIAAAGVGVYKLVIVPDYIEPALGQVAELMGNDDLTSGITKEIQRLKDEGKLVGDDVEQYLAKHSTGETAKNTDNTENSETAAEADNSSESNNSKTDTAQNTSGNAAQSQLGIESVKVKDESDNAQSGSVRTHYYKDDKNSETSSNSESNNKSETSNTVSKSELSAMNSDELYAKAKSIMSSSDYSAAVSIASKLDMGKVNSLKSSGGELAKYLQSALSEDEYLTAMDIYIRYSNCLTD